MSNSEIEMELLVASSLKLKKDEDRQDYLTRLMKAVSKLKDPEWELLSKEAKDWNNDAAEAYKGGVALAEFPDLEEESSADDPIDEEVDEEDEAPPVKQAVKKPEKEAKPAKEKEASKPQVSAAPRKVSACHTIKKMVVKKPSITVAELSEKLKAEGLKVSDVTIATLRSDLRDTLRVLNELNIGEFTL